MAAITHGETSHAQPGTIVLRVTVVALTLATAAIHASLGGMLFLANAVGYAVLAAAMVLPGPLARLRWLVRLALIGFTAATIAGWYLFGPRFGLAYLDKGIEVALIAALSLEVWLVDGGPAEVLRRARRLVAGLTSAAVTRTAR